MKIAISDIREGFGRLPLAVSLSVEDLKDRYRRSYIGVSWIILSFLAFIFIKGVVFSGLFPSPGYDFFSHLVIGFALFGFISSMIAGGANVFAASRTWILSCNQPYTLYIHNLTLRSLVELAMIAVAATVLIVVFGEVAPGYLWTLLPAVALYYLTAFSLCLVIAPVGARFRDLVYALQTLMRILFFATPIIWVATPGTVRETIAMWNPLSYYLDIIRVPIIEGRFPSFSWLVCGGITTGLLMIGLLIFNRTKRKVPLWL